jgi:hypothetical protein
MSYLSVDTLHRKETTMTSMDSMKTGKRVGLVCFALFLLAGFCFGQAARSLSGDRPTTEVRTSWTEFHNIDMQRRNPYLSLSKFPIYPRRSFIQAGNQTTDLKCQRQSLTQTVTCK